MQRQEARAIRDFQRTRLYRAERLVSEGLRWDNLTAAQFYLDRLLASPWWQMYFPSVRCVVLFHREGTYALAHKGVHGGAIQLPHWALNQRTLVHELAHIASPPETIGHGPIFAAIDLLLVQHCMGAHVAWELARHFSAHHVQVHAYEGPRHHWFLLGCRGGVRQRIAARVPSVTTARCP
jgi:putative metallohydrolase (TIGR04338 family)